MGLCVSVLALTLVGCGSDEPPLVEEEEEGPAEGAGDTFAVTEDWQLLSFDRAAPGQQKSGMKMRGPLPTELPIGLDFRPANRRLYVVTDTGRLFSINLRNGNARLVATLFADPADTTAPYEGLEGGTFGVDFNPVVDRLRIVSATGQNLRVNPDTGAVTTDARLNGAATGATAAAYTQSFAAACRTSLYVIDTDADTLNIQSPPNDGVLTTVGPLGVDAEAFNAFDIVTNDDGQDVGIAVLLVDGELAFYLIDLATGQASFLARADILATLAIVVASVPPVDAPDQAPGELYGATAKNRLVTFNRAAPGKLCTSLPISGLDGDEKVVGLDFRPSTGALHALTSASRLYVVDPLTADAHDGVALTVPLAGSEFGVDFNPTGPVALRIVSDTGQNLRVTDPTTGATTMDGSLKPGFPVVTGAAYTNSLPLAGSTTLYVIDSQLDRLFIQSPPNDGTLVDVGPLGSDVGTVDGFNIDGRNGGAILAQSKGSGPSTLHTVDLTTGTLSASLGTIGGGERLVGLTQPTPSTTVYGATEDNQLVTLSIAGAAVSSTPVGPISGLAPDESVLGLDFRPSDGRLYALTATRIYVIDPQTGAAELRSTLAADPADATTPFTGLMGTSFGVDFNPTGPVAMRVVSDAEQNLRIPNVGNGLVITDTNLAGPPAPPFAVTAAAYSNSFAGATATTLYVIDTLGDRLMVQNPPNAGTLRAVGPLGIDATEINGFEIVAADTALAALRSGNTLRLYSIDLATGAATAIGDIGCSTLTLDDLRGLSAEPSATAPAADGWIYAVNGTTLVRFPRNAPDFPVIVGGITGLVAGETVAGIDFRPANGSLYLVTSGGRVLVVDKTNAAGTEVAVLNDGAGNLVALSGTAFGVDFNPVADRLRVVSDANQNLRIVPEGGMTFVDGSLNVPGVDVVAAAYTRSFAGSTATSLYVIDAASGSLFLQNPPNDGALSRIGMLSPTLMFGGPTGFDIAGGHDGVVLAALRAAGATQSALYRVSLTTGAATLVGPIGDAAGPAIRGLAIRVQ